MVSLGESYLLPKMIIFWIDVIINEDKIWTEIHPHSV